MRKGSVEKRDEEGGVSFSKSPVEDDEDSSSKPLLLTSSSSSSSSSSHQNAVKDDYEIELGRGGGGRRPSTLTYSTFSVSPPPEGQDRYRTLPDFQAAEKFHSLKDDIIYDSGRKRVRAIFAYRAKNPSELTLEVGDIITVTNNADLDWWEGVLPNGKSGRFPSNYCTRLSPLEPPQHQQLSTTAADLHEIDQMLPSSPCETTEEDPDGSIRRMTAAEDHEEDVGVPLTLWEKVWAKASEYVFCRMLAYFLLCGIVTSLVSVGVDYASRHMYSLRSLPFSHISSKFLRFLYWFSFSAVLTSIGYALTKFISPFSAGSGIPEVKVIMSGVELPQYLSFRVLLGKVVGLTLALGAGLFVGKQGPMVHIGAAVATLLTYIPPFGCKIT